MKTVLMVIAAAAMTVSCSQQLPPDTYNVPAEPNYETIAKLQFNYVRKVIDRESEVVCYVAESRSSDSAAAISCMPYYDGRLQQP